MGQEGTRQDGMGRYASHCPSPALLLLPPNTLAGTHVLRKTKEKGKKCNIERTWLEQASRTRLPLPAKPSALSLHSHCCGALPTLVYIWPLRPESGRGHGGVGCTVWRMGLYAARLPPGEAHRRRSRKAVVQSSHVVHKRVHQKC